MQPGHSRFSRRSFLAAASAASAMAATPGFAKRPDSRTARGGVPELLDVLVVGAGLAGLHAAELLEQQGLRVAVVEASDRVGGRLRTGRAEGYTAELGGSEVGPLYGRVRDACARLNVGLLNDAPRAGPFVLDVGGDMILPANWASSDKNHMAGAERQILPFLLQNRLFFDWLPFEDPADWLNETHHKLDVSAAEFMRQRGVSEAAIRLADIDLNGPSLAAISAMSIFRDLARVKVEGFRDPTRPQYGNNSNAVSSFIEGGSDMLPRALAASLKGMVRLGAPVVQIDQTEREVEARLYDGSRIRSRFMIMAAPFSAVRHIRFTPGLPQLQANAVHGAAYSATTQFHFRVTRKFWDDDGLPPSLWSDRLYERGFHIANRGGDMGSYTVWLNGDGANRIQAMPQEAQLALIMAELEKARPSIRGALQPLFGYSWEANPFVGGNKHVFCAGQVKQFAKEMGLPHGRIHFAGEHLRRIEPGMESAMETAEIAALEVLELS